MTPRCGPGRPVRPLAAEKLARRVEAMEAGDCAALRAAGFDDRAVHDAVQVASYFSYINRVAEGLGVELEPGMPPRGP